MPPQAPSRKPATRIAAAVLLLLLVTFIAREAVVGGCVIGLTAPTGYGLTAPTPN